MSTLNQRAFSGGEVTPSLYARVDLAKYLTGLRTCRNLVVMKHGGAQNRAGTGFTGEVKDSTRTVRLLPFIFNADQTYALEFGHLYMRVIRNGAYQYDLTLTITGVTQANPAVLTYTGTDPANGEEVYITGVLGMTQLNSRNFKIANINTGAKTFELQYMDGSFVNSTAFSAYTSGGTAQRVYTITTPYVEADLQELNYDQSADIITLTHPNYAPRELARTGHTTWTLTVITFTPSIAAPASPSNNGAAGSATEWVVTAIAQETFEESLQSVSTGSSATPSSGSPITVSWSAVTGAQEYNVYKKTNGIYGFIGVAGGTSFIDNGITPDTDITPPIQRTLFQSADNYPSTSGYYQQRHLFANTNNDTEKVYTTRSGNFKNLTISTPLQDDDAITFNLAGGQVNEVRHLIDVDGLIVFTSGGEWAILGDTNGILKPDAINPKQKSYYGSSFLKPIIIGKTALFIQARQSIVRDLYNDTIEGYKGNDLTIFSSHLFEKNTIRDWTFQQNPHSIAWVVRNDGVLLGLTYIREHQFLAWHRHDFDGTVEQVLSIPEGNDDAVYVVVKRTINNATKRYVERFKNRLITDLVDAVFMDASLSYDGRNTNTSHSMVLSGGVTWAHDETLTLTSNMAYFASTDVGNQIFLTGSDGTLIRFTIEGFSSDTVVTGKASATVPVSMQGVAISDWAKAVDEIGGLWHLEGKQVSVFADKFVVANPNNDAYDMVTVANGTITLEKPYSVIHIGLPVTSDLQTLDVDLPQGESMIDKNKLIPEVNLYVEASRGIWAGSEEPTSDSDFKTLLKEYKARDEENYDDPVELATGPIAIKIPCNWNKGGRVFIRQTDPIPLSILAVAPVGFIPAFGKG